LAVPFYVALVACDATLRAKEPAAAVVESAPSTGQGEQPDANGAVIVCGAAPCVAPAQVCCSADAGGERATWCAAADAWRGDRALAGAAGAGDALQLHAACLASAPGDGRVEAGSVASASCDDSADCAPGSVCCTDYVGDTTTVTRNGSLDVPACVTDAECARHAASEHCNPVDEGPPGAKACLD
jgi:hypothetical protein